MSGIRAPAPFFDSLCAVEILSLASSFCFRRGPGFVWRENSPALWHALAERASCQCLTKYDAIPELMGRANRSKV
jgi:hypothetical protein